MFLTLSLSAQDQPAPATLLKSKVIKITLTSISLEKYGPMKADKTFKAGETVFINLEMKGLTPNDENLVAVQADLGVPALGLDKKNLVDGTTTNEDVVPMYFQIPIGSVEKGGVCTVKITIRDVVAQTYVEYNTSFNLTKENKASIKTDEKPSQTKEESSKAEEKSSNDSSKSNCDNEYFRCTNECENMTDPNPVNLVKSKTGCLGTCLEQLKQCKK